MSRIVPWAAGRCLGRAIGLLTILVLVGCGSPQRTEPAMSRCGTVRTFHVVSHGWHAGIVVERGEFARVLPAVGDIFAGADRLEIGWGDERFYRDPEPTLGLAMQAVLWPTPAVLHVVSVSGPPRAVFPESTVLTVTVPDPGHAKLLAFVEQSFTRGADGLPQRIGPGLYGASAFYRAEGRFHAFNTCNTWVASAVQASGFPLAPDGIVTAEALIAGLRAAAAERPCFTVR